MTELPPLLPRVSDYAAWHAARRPNAIASTLDGVPMTYADLASRIDELARALLAAGVCKGDRVATLQTPNPDYLVSFLATASIGAIWLGLNPRYRLEELRRAVVDADPVVLLTRSSIGERRYDHDVLTIAGDARSLRAVVVFDGDPHIDGTTSMREFVRAGCDIETAALDAPRAACGGRDPCLIVYTSGSSGTPKGALLHHAGIVAVSRMQNEYWPVEPCSIVNYFPISHVGCVVDCSMPCLIAGGTLHFMEQFDARACLDLMVRERVTIWGSVPSVFQLQLMVDGFERYDLSALQLIVWGGAAMPKALIERLKGISRRLGTNYGMTETTGTITTIEPTDAVDVLAESVGRPIAGVEVRLAGPDGAVVEDGTAGEMQVRSPYNLLGYWRRPEATAAAFTPDGFFRTGDLAVRRPDGRYKLVGRLNDMYKSGGYNVYPREIEQALESLAAIAQAAVVPVPDPLWQEVGIAYVTLKAPTTCAEIEAHCRARLASYKVPKRFVIVSELPLLPIGKVDKRALREQAGAVPVRHAAD
jgi:acyl-CoA synthetase (AMP-forming)/AMP-acid ligase II